MATQTETTTTPPPTTQLLHLASPNGFVTRPILSAPLRDARPSELPIIDVADISSTDISARRAVAARLRTAAASGSGFFYITNHGIDEVVMQTIADAARAFFRETDPATKMRAERVHQPLGIPNGYRGPHTQSVNPIEGIDVRETLTLKYSPDRDPDLADADDGLGKGGGGEGGSGQRSEDGGSIPLHVREKLTCDDGWLAEAPDALIGPLVAQYSALLTLARRMARTFALSLDLPEDAFDEPMRYPDCTLNVNYYPPLTAAPTASSMPVSIGSHTDFELFTMLWQDDTGGLQVLTPEGQWVRAPPKPGSLVVNVADCMQRITNGRYVSGVHRAQNFPTPSRSGGGGGMAARDRISLAFFSGYGLHDRYTVLESCVPEGEKARYADVSCEEWVMKRLNDMLKKQDS